MIGETCLSFAQNYNRRFPYIFWEPSLQQRPTQNYYDTSGKIVPFFYIIQILTNRKNVYRNKKKMLKLEDSSCFIHVMEWLFLKNKGTKKYKKS